MRIRYSIINTLLISFLLLLASQSLTHAQPACISDLETVELNETTLHYIECGEGEPLLLVHGSLGDYRTWASQVGSFSEEFRVISYSRRYHYPNPWPQKTSDFTVNIHAQDLVSLIRTLDLGEVHLVGHSYGALTSLLVARDNPKLIRSLTLGEPPAMSLLISSTEGKKVFQNFMRNSIRPSHKAFGQGRIEQGVRLFINGVLGEGSYGKLPPIAHIMMLENAREMKEEIKGMNENGIDFFPDFSCKDAGKITTPTLLVDGERSPKFLRLITNTLERCLPNSERAVITSASHDLKIQEPTVFSEKVLPFLKDQ